MPSPTSRAYWEMKAGQGLGQGLDRVLGQEAEATAALAAMLAWNGWRGTLAEVKYPNGASAIISQVGGTSTSASVGE